jgi:hypothetical protein
MRIRFIETLRIVQRCHHDQLGSESSSHTADDSADATMEQEKIGETLMGGTVTSGGKLRIGLDGFVLSHSCLNPAEFEM